MARRDKSLLRLDAVRVEGALIQPDILAAAASGAAEGQSAASYGIDRGLNLRDEIGRAYLIAKGLWATFQEGRGGSSPDAVHRALANGVLTKVLGFEFPHRRRLTSKTGGDLELMQAAGRVPVAIAGTEGIDHVEIVATSGADPIRRSATTLVQGEVNSREGALWGMATNGLTWRILRDNESITRPGYIEIDLARIFRDDLYSDFSAFWLTAHRSRFPQEDAAGSDCVLERWRQIGREQGVTARDDLRDGVQKALFHFGRGFLENPANKALVDRLNADGDERLTKEEFFRQLLRLVYRMIFVMTAEDREILHADGADEASKAAYANGYATGRLRERSRNRLLWDRHHDAYEGMKAVFRALRHGEPKLGLPALGGLFAPEQTPDLDAAQLTNRRFLRALYNIAWLRRDGALSRINWRDMETEEFGSVYESLLELTPVISDGGRGFSFLGEADDDKEGLASDKPTGKKAKGGAKGNERKTTGSYYTPDSLVQLLLKEALDPVIDRRVAENPGDSEALLTLKVIDPACGSGHFILAAARKIAKKLAELRHDGNPTELERHHALRDVAMHCIHGVDRNPMAVELCKVAIWIETVEPGKPLTFMDRKVRCGDSLVGVYDFACLAKGIPDEAYAALSGDDKAAAAHYRKLNARQRGIEDSEQERLAFLKPPQDLVSRAREIEGMPEDDLDQIAEKRAQFEVWQKTGWINQKRACDLWTAAFFIPKKHVPPFPGLYEVPLTDNVWTAWSGTLPPTSLTRAVDKAAEDGAFLHWPLVFADVMEDGGFDCVIGNPPWEVLELDEVEYFASRVPEIAELAGSARKKAIVALENAIPEIFATYVLDKRTFDAGNEFARSSGRFERSARGKINTYALFADLFSRLPSLKGRAGVIVPTGIATDATTAPFFAALVDERRLAVLIDFENRERIFPAIDMRMKFCVLVVAREVAEARFSFFLYNTTQLSEKERIFTLSPKQISAINPNTKTAPVFRSRADAELTANVHRLVPVFVDETKGSDGNPWRIEFRQGLFNMTSDSSLFRTASQLRAAGYVRRGTDWIKTRPPAMAESHSTEMECDGTRRIPLYEAKMVNFYDHRAGSYRMRGDDRGYRVLPPTEETDHKDCYFEPEPYYWVEKKAVEDRLDRQGWKHQWLLGWKDITSSTNERTLIPSLIPRVGCGDTFLLAFPGTADKPRSACLLLANWSSLATDYVTRQKIGGLHLKYNIFKQINVLPWRSYSDSDRDFVTSRVLELTYTSQSLKEFAHDLNYNGPPFEWDEHRRSVLRAELDAFYAKAYGLTRDELRYVLDPADVRGEAYPTETFRSLKQNEMSKYGEYRTRRLVLEAWDRQSSKLDAA